MLEEFKKFALRGNVIDLAVGIMVGAAFGKIVSALVNNVLMPPIGLIIGGVNFKDLGITLKEAAGDQPAVMLGYGEFLQACFDFLIIALVIFYLVKVINTIGKKPAEAPATPPPPTRDQELLTEIRDLLKK